MGSISKAVKKIVSAVGKIVKVIVKVVVFIVKAIVNFVKGVFKGDIASIVMLIAIVFTFGAALGFLGPLIASYATIEGAIAMAAFTVLASEYQLEKAKKLQKSAEDELTQQKKDAEVNLAEQQAGIKRDLDLQSAGEEARLKQHFEKMEGERYKGYESGTFGIGSFEPPAVLPTDGTAVDENSSISGIGFLFGCGLFGSLFAYTALNNNNEERLTWEN